MFIDKVTYENSAPGGPETKPFRYGPYEAIIESAQQLRGLAAEAKPDHASSLIAEAESLEKRAEEFVPISPPNEEEWESLKRQAETLRRSGSKTRLLKIEKTLQKFCTHAHAKINCGKCPTCGFGLDYVMCQQ